MNRGREKQLVHEGTVYSFSSDWLDKLESEEHWRTYWQQQKIMEGRIHPGEEILEIGPGTGFTANYLRTKGFEVTTVDIDSEKNPDIVANIVTFDPDRSFDHVLAFEVFEHIPFEQFVQVVGRLSKKCRRYFFVSLPRCIIQIARVECQIVQLGTFDLSLPVPRRGLREPYHFWELGYRDIRVQKVAQIFSDVGFQLEASKKKFTLSFFAFQKRDTMKEEREEVTSSKDT